MKVCVISFSDNRGGAAKAANRQVKAIKKYCPDWSVNFLVAEKISNDDSIIGPNKLDKTIHFFLRVMSFLITKLQITKNKSKHSLNIFSSRHVINSIDYSSDVIHLHWFNNDTISLSKLMGILSEYKGKIVITMHDDWLFCGLEHSSYESVRFIDGYHANNSDNLLLDLDRAIFNKKLKIKSLLERKKVILTTPSLWMLKRASSSLLLRNANLKYVPNIIDCDLFKPYPKLGCRHKLEISNESFVISFGAVGGVSNPLKGYDLLIRVLNHLNKNYTEMKCVELLVFGGDTQCKESLCGFNITYTGVIESTEDMAMLYSSADLVLVPSLIESFGQVAAESLACETPVIAFDNSGVSEVIRDNGGIIIDAFDIEEFSKSIFSFYSLSELERRSMGRKGRLAMIKKYSPETVSAKWKDVYCDDNK
ncbi:glycosyl transferase [Yersinia mollaretii ATCC 43969]|uniref:Glycosyl transferase n=1 Tax=Yersinia mollaretii (strain ATCC 43969 / DSM 18520 / CIP 103324 / CNY 7263 / WAIP 204) TaxID=349967 RepID=A0ABM9YEP3_YERMW|nr:glycosyltransferase [Yersinia mollaretii]EEQ12405.1 glycosyl transferase [Yersinia mollaretii ATCC 43969]QKJ03458.1 glycosyltransferase [Yersinia mollaretii ATCC 43969]